MKKHFKKRKGIQATKKPDETSILNWLRRAKGSPLSTLHSESDAFMYVPDEIVRNIDRALDNMAKAQQGLIKARDEKTLRERPEPDNNDEPKNE